MDGCWFVSSRALTTPSPFPVRQVSDRARSDLPACGAPSVLAAAPVSAGRRRGALGDRVSLPAPTHRATAGTALHVRPKHAQPLPQPGGAAQGESPGCGGGGGGV